MLLGLVIAGVIAYCNAVSSAQLAAVYPTSGGTYVYGRERLGVWWGFIAGWAFVIGKTASCAAMALTFATYAVPGPSWVQRLVGVGGVLVLVAVNYRGVTKTAALTRVLVACTLVALAVCVAAILNGSAGTDRLGGWHALGAGADGYARIATMGEEVIDPRRTIPRAIPLALAIAFGVYLIVGSSALIAAGPDALAHSTAPLTTAVRAAGADYAVPVVRVGAALASLGALLALIAGVGRTSLAMARGGDLPRWLGGVHPRYRVPHHAELAVAAVVSVLVATTDLRGVLGFSSFGVLTYYAIANASAFTQPQADRRWPRAINVLGIAGCTVLAMTLPPRSIVAALVVFGIGLIGRWVAGRARARA
jgi:APA family basic amino acid/polyamine antiporter